MSSNTLDIEYPNSEPKKTLFELELVEISSSPTEPNNATKTIPFGIDLKKFLDFIATSSSSQSQQPKQKQTTTTTGQHHHYVYNVNLKWLNDAVRLKVRTNLSKMEVVSFGDQEEAAKFSQCTIDECIRLFTCPEKLTSENPWYCSKCKKHQEATKQMSLWRLPKYLIVTLKRFQASKATDNFFGMSDEATRYMAMNSRFSYLLQNRVVYNKLNTFIDFPLK